MHARMDELMCQSQTDFVYVCVIVLYARNKRGPDDDTSVNPFSLFIHFCDDEHFIL